MLSSDFVYKFCDIVCNCLSSKVDSKLFEGRDYTYFLPCSYQFLNALNYIMNELINHSIKIFSLAYSYIILDQDSNERLYFNFLKNKIVGN